MQVYSCTSTSTHESDAHRQSGADQVLSLQSDKLKPYSICLCPYTLCVCPYAIKRMPLCYYDCVLTLSGNTKVGVWRQVVLDNLYCGKTLRFCFEVITKGQHQTDIPPLFEVFMMS